jgi:hypothetical protein
MERREAKEPRLFFHLSHWPIPILAEDGQMAVEKLKSRKEAGPRVIMITANEGSRHRAYAEMLGVE